MHCIQPREEKIFKSIATSPPPFSPFAAQHYSHHQKYATTGTQTYFTKAPNSPNNLLSSQFAVLQTPTITGVPSNPFVLTPSVCDNKENKEPTTSSKLRNICLNRSISSFKHDTIAGGTCSSASSPSSVISTSPKFIATSPKVNTNVLQQQNSPTVISSNESPRFNFSPKILSSSQTPPITGHSLSNSVTGSPLSVATSYRAGNYFRFPDIETPPVYPSSSSPSAAATTRNDDQITNVPTTMTMLRKTFENLSIDSSTNSCCNKESIILKIDEVESPEEKSPVVAPCNTLADDKGKFFFFPSQLST